MTVLLAIIWWPALLALVTLACVFSVAVVLEAADRYGRRIVEQARTDLDRDRLP